MDKSSIHTVIILSAVLFTKDLRSVITPTQLPFNSGVVVALSIHRHTIKYTWQVVNHIICHINPPAV